ncbi:hypothetical protein [Algiphilus sp.]|uniref:glycine-rich domain-containing protein n=1 Tax=Algiphilus sp. TaxID=1872431 RepID=UPI0025BBEC2E|nr:hypothetical protein [Algiphilus sp.]
MRMVVPAQISETELIASNIVEDDAPAYDDEVTYDTSDQVQLDHRVYESTADGNTDHPVGSANWTDLGPTNRYRMFDQTSTRVSLRTGAIDVTVQPDQLINAVSLINCRGLSATVQVLDDDEGVLYSSTRSLVEHGEISDWWSYFYAPIEQLRQVSFLDLPNIRGAKIRILVTAGGAVAQIGEAVLGAQADTGLTYFDTSLDVDDFSRRDEDDFGNVTIVKRGYRDVIGYNVRINTPQVQSVRRRLLLARQRVVLWIGAPYREETIVLGFYEQLRISIKGAKITRATIDVVSLVVEDTDPFYGEVAVNTPEILTPSFGSDMPANGRFLASAFSTSPEGDDSAAHGDWEIATDQAFGSVVLSTYDDVAAITSWSPDMSSLTEDAEYWVRHRRAGTTAGDSAWATPIKIVARPAVTIDTPAITTPAASATHALDVPIESSAYATTGGDGDAQASASWQIATDAGFTSIEAESLHDTENLTSWLPPPTVATGVTRYVRVRHEGALTGNGTWSPGVECTFAVPASQQEWTTPGTYEFIVPNGITALAGLCIGAGAQGAFKLNSQVGSNPHGGGGGALRWRNAIAVTPGEPLTVEVGASGPNGGDCRIRRGSTTLLWAQGGQGREGGIGTAIGGDVGGGNGGRGGYGRVYSTAITVGGGGGAGGYQGDANSETGGAASNGPGSHTQSLPAIATGGGGGGLDGEGAAGATNSAEGGSGGENGASSGGDYGGGGPGYCYTSGAPVPGGAGAVRILWGAGRAYPDTNTADV